MRTQERKTVLRARSIIIAAAPWPLYFLSCAIVPILGVPSALLFPCVYYGILTLCTVALRAGSLLSLSPPTDQESSKSSE